MSIKLKGSTDGSVTLQAPADTSPTGTDKTLILPTGVGSANQFLQNSSTAGTLEFGALVSGDMPTGSILQVVQSHVTTTSSQAVSQNTTTDITDLSANITPKSSTSDMLVFVMWHGELSANPNNSVFGLKRGTTAIGNPAAAGSRSIGIANMNMGYYGDDNASTIDSAKYQFFDTGRSSGTSQITYQATIRNSYSGGITVYNNRTVSDVNAAGYERCASSVTIFEVAA